MNAKELSKNPTKSELIRALIAINSQQKELYLQEMGIKEKLKKRFYK